MAKDPAFLFYPGDWQGGTSTFSRHIKGCYLDVLIAQFNSGPLSLEEIKVVLGTDFAVWGTLAKKFKITENGLFFNEKLEKEKNRRKEYSQSRRDNINSRYKEKEDNSTCVDTSVDHMYLHMETETRTTIIDYLNIKASTKFKGNSEKTKKVISARIKEGYKVEDFKKVIDIKCKKWLTDNKMRDFLRPETLFGNKFESYLNEKENGGTDKNNTSDAGFIKPGTASQSF